MHNVPVRCVPYRNQSLGQALVNEYMLYILSSHDFRGPAVRGSRFYEGGPSHYLHLDPSSSSSEEIEKSPSPPIKRKRSKEPSENDDPSANRRDPSKRIRCSSPVLAQVQSILAQEKVARVAKKSTQAQKYDLLRSVSTKSQDDEGIARKRKRVGNSQAQASRTSVPGHTSGVQDGRAGDQDQNAEYDMPLAFRLRAQKQRKRYVEHEETERSEHDEEAEIVILMMRLPHSHPP